MKIAVLSSHTPSLFWFRMDMMQAFADAGHTVIAIGNEPVGKWQEKFAKNNVKYISANISRTGTNPISDIKTFLSLRKILKREKPDKIFAYQAKTVIYGCLAAWSVGIREIYSLIAGCGSVFLGKGIKSAIIKNILRTEYHVALKKCRNVFFQNPDDVDLFTSLNMVAREKTVMLNGSGVNTEKFEELPFPDEPAFLCISRLIRDKGVYEYLEAAKRVKYQYPNVRFLLVGPFDTNPSALTREELSVYEEDGTIEYFGEQTDVIPFLRQCTVFVLPSYREGTPKTVLEAMSSGRAVITTDAPGCRETVTDGLNGFLVPIKDIDALSDKMVYMINHNDEAKKMALEGRKIALEKFDVKLVNQKIINTMKLRSNENELVQQNS